MILNEPVQKIPLLTTSWVMLGVASRVQH